MLNKLKETVPRLKSSVKQVTFLLILIFLIFSLFAGHSPPLAQAQGYGLDWEFRQNVGYETWLQYGGALTWGRDKFVGIGIRAFLEDSSLLYPFYSDDGNLWQEASGLAYFIPGYPSIHSIIPSYYGQAWVAVGEEGIVVTNSSPDLDSWWIQQETPTSSTLHDVVECYGFIGDIYIARLVAVGENGTVITTFMGGDNWVTLDVPGDVDSFYSVTKYATYDYIASGIGGILVLVGEGGVVRVASLTLDLNLEWLVRKTVTPKGYDLYGVTHGTPIGRDEPLVVAVGENGVIMTSSDGNWIQRDSKTDKNLYDVTWTGKLFVAVGASGTIVSSPNGFDWTVNDSITNGHFRAVTSSENEVIAVTSDYDIFGAKNALNLEITVSAWPHGTGMAYGGGTFGYGKEVHVKAVANPGYKFEYWTDGSPDGKIVSHDEDYYFTATLHRHLVANFKNPWTQLAPENAVALAYGDGKPDAAFDKIGVWRYDGKAWTRLAPENAVALEYYAGSLAVAFEDIGVWRYDGKAWTRLAPENAVALAYDHKDRLAVAFQDIGLWHYDGYAWTRLAPENAVALAYDSLGRLAVAFKDIGVWRYDGKAWTRLAPENAVALAYDHKDRLAVAFKDIGLWRYDGKAWTQLAPEKAVALTYDSLGRLAVAFKDTGVWLNDRKTWTLLAPEKAVALAYDNGSLAVAFESIGVWCYE